MRKMLILTTLAAALTLARAPGARAADGSGFQSTFNPGDGLFGYSVWGTDTNSRGFIWGYNDATNANLGWSMGLERTHGDLYLYNYNTINSGTVTASNHYPFRLRGDTGQLELGPSTTLTHPSSSFQLGMTAGTSTAPLGGMQIGGWGNYAGLYMYQNQSSLKRTSINFNGVYLMGTDSGQNNTPDWWLWNAGTGNFVLTANSDDSLTVKGGLQHTGSALGFYGAPTVSKQTIYGCRSDGTALASLITALKNLGLVNDNTTP